MKEKFLGYVVCATDMDKQPIGVVSDSYECKVKANYIPKQLKDLLIQIEDKRFYDHVGIDVKGIIRALVVNVKAGKIVQGGSTITQQLARSILGDNSKSIIRKIREVRIAFILESKYTKDEILDLYFDNLYFGKNLRGIRGASLCYFNKEIDKLSHPELLYLLTILRGPNFYIRHLDSARSRYLSLSKILYRKKLISKNRYNKYVKAEIVLKPNPLQIIRSNVIPFIANAINDKQKIISSTINDDIQKFATKFVSGSKYPVSIIAIKDRSVVAFASSYGTEYPFISKANVGSTLKPFLYCHFIDGGISKSEKFNALKNDLNWDVREANYYRDELNLEEALFYSNNNSFVNASYRHGIDNTLQFLANIFNRDLLEFHPASILGATKSGISLYELALAYNIFFSNNKLTETKIECLSILNSIFISKLGFVIHNSFLKTGTTNDNKERYAVLGNPELTFAVLRNENTVNDLSKDGNFLDNLSQMFYPIFNNKHNYKWIK